ncbi:MAG: hypothetical protein A2754_03515 [Candidatus Magasanikbacteria bacterium RIFCSPHIGHO2_01_FULL_47_8]|uniref:SAM-dependent methyltransferase n=1 Tax=Candidatus Magasanikbacteria bacterium RIFCSPHIGHO2_01_FULL_47_8 TaxID=1798673 RepID=A0A1F6MFJ5_9BACT|nr:MAG: hypothetical protein A2754_03515 [Candidatus Magasanikbacteria bacterium RIFCSPHIGHO2_01_FULL_47_8]
MHINTRCRICRGQNLTKVLDLGSQPLANAFLQPEDISAPEPIFPLEMYVCTDCYLAQLIHVVDKEVLFTNYIYFSSGMPKLSDHFREYAEDIITRFLKPNDLVVELGSNDGILLQFFKDRAFRPLGIDPAKNIAILANACGIPTIAEFFSEPLAGYINKIAGQAKAIIGNNVVAHINDYQDLGRAIKTLLHPDGVFVFEAPYLIDMFENITFDTIYHEHLSFLAIYPLTRLFEQFGLEIFEVQVVPAQGQSLRVFVGRTGAHPIDASVNTCLDKEISLGLRRLEAYQAMAKKIVECKERVTKLIYELRNQGKRLAAYGAPAKGNTLLNYYAIGPALLDFALDELSSKNGLYTPGQHLPVIDRETANKQAPDYYFLLAWNYRKVILEKEASFLARGGAFILPTGEIIRAP